MAGETVKINMVFELSGAPYALDQKADTGLTREEWDALSQEEREGVADKHIQEWQEELYGIYWEEAE